MDKISIIMPTYCRSSYLQRAMSSALNQTYENIELIVIDDNGEHPEEREKVQAILKEYCMDQRVKYIVNEQNLGGAMSRNQGIWIAKGDYITFLDDDDEYLSEKVRIQHQYMVDNELDVCIMDGATFDMSGALVGEKHQVFPEHPTYETLMVSHMLYHLTGTNTIMFKAEALRRIGGFSDVPAGHEYFLMEKAIEARLVIGYLPQVLVRNCTHGYDRVSTGTGKIVAQKLILKAKEKHFNLLNCKQKRFIFCEYYGGVFYIKYTQKKYAAAAWYLLCAVTCSPHGALSIFAEKKGRLARNGSEQQ